MGILYLKEHTSCYNYTKCIREGFLYYKFQIGETSEEKNVTNHILFVMDGCLELFYNGELLKLSAGNMICLHRGSICKISSPGKAKVVVAQFDDIIKGCEKFSLSELFDRNIRFETEKYYLEIKYNLKLFLENLILYLESGAGCTHFHEIKLKELFWILRFYYTKSEQALLFRFILGKDYDFKRQVLNNYRNARTVKELARLCGLPLSSFKRKFLREFREPTSSWLQKQINGLIKYRLTDDNIPIGEIAQELNFSSQPQFCTYCKRNLGCTPGEWRKLLKNKTKTPGKR